MIVGFGKFRNEHVEDLETGYIVWCLEKLPGTPVGDRNKAVLTEMEKQLALRRGEGVQRKAGAPLRPATAAIPADWVSGVLEVVGVRGGRGTLQARIRGPFAVHLTQHDLVGEAASDWTLSHVPTGMFIAKGLPSSRAAIALAGDIEGLIDWASATNETVGRLTHEVHDRLQVAIEARRRQP